MILAWSVESQDSRISCVEHMLSKGQTSGSGRWVDFEELPITSSAGFSVNSINPARRHEECDGHSLIQLRLLVSGGGKYLRPVEILSLHTGHQERCM